MRTGWLSWVRANDKTIIDMLENQGVYNILRVYGHNSIM